MLLRLGTWNLDRGAIDVNGEKRLWAIVETLRHERLDVVGLVEAKWGPRGNRLLHDIAHRLGMSWRTLVPAARYGCDIALLIREGRIHVVQERHEQQHPWFHALARVETSAPGVGRLDIVVNHFAPSVPEVRAQEAGMFRLFRKQPAIALGDYNAVACDELSTGEVEADQEHTLDVTPAKIIAQAGFVDVGAVFGDLSPTVGFETEAIAYRSDRIYANVSNLQVRSYKVLSPVRGNDLLSDHAGVVAELAFGVT